MALLEDFKKFAFKGNVVDLAVGVIVGAAFGKIVSALVADIVMPLVALALPSGDWREAGIVLAHGADPKHDVVLKYGDFLGSVIDFLVVSFVLFILVSKIIAVAQARLGTGGATTKECPFCLEMVPNAAKKCKACTSELPAT